MDTLYLSFDSVRVLRVKGIETVRRQYDVQAFQARATECGRLYPKARNPEAPGIVFGFWGLGFGI